MLRCSECQPLILDQLYGLLEPAETAKMEAHMAGCPACTAARDEAVRLQGLIARAARDEFPQVRFVPPTPSTRSAAAARPIGSPSSPSSLESARTPTSRSSDASRLSRRLTVWLPWAVAAALLLAVPGSVLPMLGRLDRAEQARHQADAAVDRLAQLSERLRAADGEARRLRDDARRSLVAARQARDGILATWIREEAALLQSLTARQLSWDLLKPATLQPGAPNELWLVIRDRSVTPEGRLLAEVRDQTDAVIFSQSIDAQRRQDRDHVLRLPARIWERLTPESELFLSLSSEDQKTGKRTELQERVRLFGPVYTTHLTTDKAVYRPGETIYLRSLTLDRTTFSPPTREQLLSFELRGPDGRVLPGGVVTGSTELVRFVDGRAVSLVGPDGRPLRGVGTAAFVLPSDAIDGPYTITLRELPHPAGYPPVAPLPVTRTVSVRSDRAGAYRKEIGFSRASYAPGELVEAWAELRHRDQPVGGVEAMAVATADRKPLDVQPVTQPVTGADGRVRFRFRLPAELERGDVRLKVVFRTPDGEEAVTGRVSVAGKGLIVEFFPEGGDLVAGLESRVYFRATTPAGEPVDVSGIVTDGRRVLAEVHTATDPDEPGANRGIGSFTLTPEPDRPLWLQLRTPAGATTPLRISDRDPLPAAPVAVAGAAAVVGSRTGFLLPEAKPQGVVMTVRDPVTTAGQPVRVLLRATGSKRSLVVGAYIRGRLADMKRIRLTGAPGEVGEVTLLAGTDPRGGVVRITVFEEPEAPSGATEPDWIPVAERLVYRKPRQSLDIGFTVRAAPASQPRPGPDRLTDSTSPDAAAEAELQLTATDEQGRPAAAVLYAAVVNAAVAPGPRDRRLTTHFLLAGEISTPDAMEHADFLLSSHPKAAETLDRVLATQGWRRFAEQTRPRFGPRPSVALPDYARLLAVNGQFGTWAEPPAVKEQRRLRETYLPRFEFAVRNVEEAERQLAAVEADTRHEAQLRALADELRSARDAAEAAAEQAVAAREPLQRMRGTGWLVVVSGVLLALVLGCVGYTCRGTRLPLALGSIASLGLVGVWLAVLLMTERTLASPVRLPETDLTRQAAASGGDLTETPVTPSAVTTATPDRSDPIVRAGTDDQPMTDGAVPPHSDAPGVAVAAPSSASTPPSSASTSPSLASVPTASPPPAAPPVGKNAQPQTAGGTGAAPPTVSGRLSPGLPAFSARSGATWTDDPGPSDQPGPTFGDTKTGSPLASPAHPTLLPGLLPPRNRPWPLPSESMTTRGWELDTDTGKRGVGDEDWRGKRSVGRSRPEALVRAGSEPALPADHSGAPRRAFSAGTRPQLSFRADRSDQPTGAVGAAGAPVPTEAARPEAHPTRRLDDVIRRQVNQRLEQLRESLRATLDAHGPGHASTPAESTPAESNSGWPQTTTNPAVPHAEATRRLIERLAVERVWNAVPSVTPLVVREYAAPRPGSELASETDEDLLLWQPVLVLPDDGRVRLALPIGSAAGGYRLVVAGHTLDGRIGAIDAILPAMAAGPAGSTSPVPPATNPEPKKR